ncbi:glycosyltransferase family 2 protein [Coraliomargarita sp. SDUM461004]|uniref:Glycosyltransferase family 2 protein n=1 Tax=Thalassobacterium sedimentorum TaxID=3041258 RepID=A0ABU1AK29_9BACT|nr:glycosyltransferase family 2 protein [Coraliomargarita sp. SDUM461004]MDQ8195151.1 glycosyltransferase family 2 protein [Coraliomargarita sp. SDUM461004]
MNISSAQALMPEISVVISTYDDRKFLAKKLKEVCAQTAFARAEFIFIEPASPGNEYELLLPFCEQYENCKLIRLEHRISLYQAWNLGWEAASAEIVCISNMDDAMHPELLERVIGGMRENDWDVASVLIAKQDFGDSVDCWEPEHLRELELSTRPGPFFAWKSDLKARIGMFDESLILTGDKDFWSKIIDCGLQGGLVRKVLYLYTKHSNQLSKREEFIQLKQKERKQCKSRAYPYVWPSWYARQVRLIRAVARVPWVGSLFYVPDSEPTGSLVK